VDESFFSLNQTRGLASNSSSKPLLAYTIQNTSVSVGKIQHNARCHAMPAEESKLHARVLKSVDVYGGIGDLRMSSRTLCQ
jgi:hypothetical protein